jgi:competence protein ComFC
MANFQPRRIIGNWKDGYALDLHTLSSVPIGSDEFGHIQFDTTRSDIGELLYRFKYRSDSTAADEITDAVEALVKAWKPRIDILIPVPPSSSRAVQPVLVLADAIGERLHVAVMNCVTRVREVPQLKNVYDLDERAKLLDGLHTVDASQVRGKSILLFDDLFRSGATMNAISSILYEKGKASDVYALTITRTRSNQ